MYKSIVNINLNNAINININIINYFISVGIGNFLSEFLGDKLTNTLWALKSDFLKGNFLSDYLVWSQLSPGTLKSDYLLANPGSNSLRLSNDPPGSYIYTELTPAVGVTYLVGILLALISALSFDFIMNV